MFTCNHLATHEVTSVLPENLAQNVRVANAENRGVALKETKHASIFLAPFNGCMELTLKTSFKNIKPSLSLSLSNFFCLSINASTQQIFLIFVKFSVLVIVSLISQT